jgi:hypothetical protein
LSVTLNVYQALDVTVDGVQLLRGSRSAPTAITVDGRRKEWNRSLATATTATVWDGTDTSEPLADFDALYIKSDQILLVEFTCDKGAEVGTVVFARKLLASEPMLILHDDAMALYTANFATGTADVIDRIRVRNESGSTAIVDVLLIT